MSRARVSSGNEAVAEAVRQVCPDVAAGYPTIPISPVLDRIASLIADGRLESEFICADSDHSALCAAVGAAAAGGRVFVATASQGLAQMQEMLYIAASLRLPIVAAIANRALSAPINIHCDHSDSMAQRDSGWIQLYSENVQEMYDNMIQAFKIAEHPEVKTPVMVCMDGFITSHAIANFTGEETAEVENFVGKPAPAWSMLDLDHPVTAGSFHTPDTFFEQKIHQVQGIENSRMVIRDVGKEYGRLFGRYYGFFESYKLEDAEMAAVVMSSAAGTAREAVDELRNRGEKVGLLKLRMFRPFPHRELRDRLGHLKAVAALDRSVSPGAAGGPLFMEIRGALYELEHHPLLFPCVYGLGGRNISVRQIQDEFAAMKEKMTEGVSASYAGQISYIGLRGAG